MLYLLFVFELFEAIREVDLLNQEQELDEVSFVYVCGVACRHGLLTEGYSSEEFVQEIEVYVTFTILSRT